MTAAAETREWLIGGQVQGVGYRPFVIRQAKQFQISGWVRNETGTVRVVATGHRSQLEQFRDALTRQAPVIAKPRLLGEETTAHYPGEGFRILSSKDSDNPQIHIPPDYFMCPDCAAELANPSDRRYRYPFINCTQCGPRYTLIKSLPYDRENTTMASFRLCAACKDEYTDPLDRRFHAEPVACPDCGPTLVYQYEGQRITDNEAALEAAVNLLSAGKILAVKGIGGYHLLCNAGDEKAVARLRQRKQRPDKPLAVMFPDMGKLQADVMPTCSEREVLLSPARPVVLCQKRSSSQLADAIAPGLSEMGAFLPYSPVHHLLCQDFAAPLVATSGNISGEPVIISGESAENKLAKVADAFLHHDRKIERPADDAVYRTIQGVPRPFRLGRGQAPIELALPYELDKPVLALGGHMKSTVALAWGKRIVISSHLGDLDTVRSLDLFVDTIATLQSLYRVKAETLIADSHRSYGSRRWAKSSSLPVTLVYHHHAHASAVYGECVNDDTPLLVFTWDGAGLGEDGTIQGGETFHGRPGEWQRVGSLRPFYIVGGDQAAREPWRCAAAFCWEAGLEAAVTDPMMRQAWERKIHAAENTSVGRLFDAASSLLGLCDKASFEGQGPMLLEAIANDSETFIAMPQAKDSNGLLRTNWQPLIEYLVDSGAAVEEKAAVFHNSLAAGIQSQIALLSRDLEFDAVGLSGGVFQNRRLVETVMAKLASSGVRVHLQSQTPTNDAGLSFGQVIEYACSGRQ